MLLSDIHNFMDFALGDERGAFLTPPEKDMILDRAQWWLFNQEVDYYAKNQVLKDSLSVFSTPFQFSSNSDGEVSLPTDKTQVPCYQHLLAMYAQYYDNRNQRIRYRQIKFINEDEIAERLDSQILAPTKADPVGQEIQPGGFQLYPKIVHAGRGFYLRDPRRPLTIFTENEDGRTIVFDDDASTQLEWDESSLNKIIIKALQLAGVNINDELIIQFTAQKDQAQI